MLVSKKEQELIAQEVSAVKSFFLNSFEALVQKIEGKKKRMICPEEMDIFLQSKSSSTKSLDGTEKWVKKLIFVKNALEEAEKNLVQTSELLLTLGASLPLKFKNYHGKSFIHPLQELLDELTAIESKVYENTLFIVDNENLRCLLSRIRRQIVQDTTLGEEKEKVLEFVRYLQKTRKCIVEDAFELKEWFDKTFDDFEAMGK